QEFVFCFSVLIVVGLHAGLRGTQNKQATVSAAAVQNSEPEAYSLLGQPLHRMQFSQARAQELLNDLAKAQEAYEKDPDNPERIIWLGRRSAYLTRYREAINIYSEGLQKHPNNPKLLRHRGHRYISIREFDRAIADLETAARLAENLQDEIEPDGQPNKYNKPRSTLKSNIWYHLGLAFYLKGDFENALAAYQECMKYSTWNDDMLCATSDWLYMTHRRLGNHEEAQKLLEPINESMEILENLSYHRRLLMYKGLKQPAELLDVESDNQLDIATQGYGVGNWYFYNGRKEKAEKIFQKVIQGTYWPAFGYIAAEADLLRMRQEQ
ncbi:MAG: tetratricopeptide repeat protein, partial [bacterium]